MVHSGTSDPTFTVQLRDGRSVTVRPITPEDKDGLNDAVMSLSDESRYTRFMAATRQWSAQVLEAATHPKPRQECALVAVSGDPVDGVIVGGARYASLPDSHTCEFAVTVND